MRVRFSYIIICNLNFLNLSNEFLPMHLFKNSIFVGTYLISNIIK